MTVPLRSDLNDFLFTSVADDSSGMHLTVLSVLARSGVDPWEEAAGLRILSRADATERLVHMLAGVPNGPSPGDDSVNLATRLVEQLHSPPKSPLKPISSTAAGGSARGEQQPLRAFSTLPVRVKLTIYSLVALILMVAAYRALIG